MKKIGNGLKNFFKNLKNTLILMDKKKLLIIILIIIIIIIVILVLLLKPKTIKCEQTVEFDNITNKNTVEITYKGDTIKEVKTTFDYKTEDAKYVITQIKDSMQNLSKVYKNVTGVTFNQTKDKATEYQAVQTVDFKEISDEDLANIGIVRDYEQAKSNYEASGFTCK